LVNYIGDRIQEEFITKREVNNYKSKSRLRWPLQGRPNMNTFKVWVSYLRNIIECNDNIKLRNPLGEWISNVRTDRILEITCWAHRSLKYIVKKSEHRNWYKHLLTKSNYGDAYYNKESHNIPNNFLNKITDIVPCTFDSVQEFWIIKTRKLAKKIKIEDNHPTTTLSLNNNRWGGFIRNLVMQKNIIMFQTIKLYNTHLIDDEDNIKIDICSDGGVRNNKAGFGLIATSENQTIVTIAQILPEIHNPFTSHRSEAFGLLCAFQLITAINHFKNMNDKNKKYIIRVHL
jgi:hypothetical protein